VSAAKSCPANQARLAGGEGYQVCACPSRTRSHGKIKPGQNKKYRQAYSPFSENKGEYKALIPSANYPLESSRDTGIKKLFQYKHN